MPFSLLHLNLFKLMKVSFDFWLESETEAEIIPVDHALAVLLFKDNIVLENWTEERL